MRKKHRDRRLLSFVFILLAVGFFLVSAFKISSSFREFREALRGEEREELIGEISCNKGEHKVLAYLVNGGATVDWSVIAYLIEGKNKREIYRDYHIKEANMSFIDCNKVVINGHEIDLPYGKYDFRENWLRGLEISLFFMELSGLKIIYLFLSLREKGVKAT